MSERIAKQSALTRSEKWYRMRSLGKDAGSSFGIQFLLNAASWINVGGAGMKEMVVNIDRRVVSLQTFGPVRLKYSKHTFI